MGEWSLKPAGITYGIVLVRWYQAARAGDTEKAERLDRLLFELRQEFPQEVQEYVTLYSTRPTSGLSDS